LNKKSLLKKVLLIAITSVIVGLIYGSYFYFLGIPKTQARNYYNMAIKDLEDGKISDAKDKLEQAVNYWPEEYIEEKLKELKSIE
jgi:outer membrane protein assembly factor BamD (BamD/ComL family)